MLNEKTNMAWIINGVYISDDDCYSSDETKNTVSKITPNIDIKWND